MRTIIRSTTAASALLALLLAGCGGGGHASNALPATATNAPGTGGGTSSSKRAPATFTLVVPSGGSKSAAKRSPKYISAAIQSLSVSAVPAAGGTAVTASENVSTCPTVSGTETCTLTVQAPVGSDVFTVTMYDGANETGNVLGSGTETGTVVIDTANAFPLTLSGTVATVELSLATPALPVVSGGSTLVAVGGVDAGGYLIIGSYTNAINLTAAAGVTLNPTSVTAAGTSVTATYDGVSKTPLAITAASAGATSATASVIPTTHVLNYTGQTATVGGSSDVFRIIKGPDGAYYFGDIGATQSMGSNSIVTGTTGGAIGRLDPTTGTIAEVQIAGVDPTGLAFNGDDLYFCELASGKVGRILGAASGTFSASTYSEQILPNSPPAGVLTPGTGNQYDAPRDIVAINGLLYVTEWYHRDLSIIDPSNWSASSTANVTTVANNNGGNSYLAGIAYSQVANQINMIMTNWDVESYTPGSGATSMTDLGYLSNANIPGSGRFVAVGPDGNFYYTIQAGGDFTNPGGIFVAPPGQNFNTAGPAKQLPVAYPGWGPDSIHAGSGSTVIAGDLAYGAIDVFDTSAQAYTIFPITVMTDNAQNTGAQDVADDGSGQSFYFSYGTNSSEVLSSSVRIGRVALAGWTLLPETTASQVIDGTGPNSATLISVAGLSTNGVQVSAIGANCSVASANQSANAYLVTGVSPGTCTISATDGNRTVTRAYTVTSSSATITSRKRISK